ncbi:hypothetical protein BGX21_009040 [Mortierella sp. AD011]|nr:hypothetical protein BGX21_009040 [Mortierella sp. AD011]
MTSASLTTIPSTQPSCGNISLQHPIPHCPSGNGSTNNNPMGCFIQKNGFFCAPISTTRGFLYTSQSSVDDGSSTETESSRLIPILSIATNDNITNPSPPLLGVDGQPVNYQGPARLGETCVGIPLPPATSPLFQTLVSIANQQLNITTGYLPGAGAGQDIFSLRGDCEQGSYCDLSSPGGGLGTCMEQFPESHNCTSYMQCISLRCDEIPLEPTKTVSRKKRSIESFWDFFLFEISPQYHTIHKRATSGPTVCLSSKIHRGANSTGSESGDGLGIGGSGDTNGVTGDGSAHSRSKFPGWMGAVIVIVVILGTAFIFGFAKRRKKLKDEREKRARRASRGLTKRDRTRSATLPSNIPDEKIAHHYQTQSEQPQSQHDRKVGFFGMLFGLQDKTDNELQDRANTQIVRNDHTDTPSLYSVGESNADSFSKDNNLSREAVSVCDGPTASLNALEHQSPSVTTRTSTDFTPGGNMRPSVIIPNVTTTLSEEPQYLISPTAPFQSSLSAERGKFEDGESPLTSIHHSGSLAPTVCDSDVQKSSSSFYDTSLSDSSSSHAFFSTPPSTSPHVPSPPVSPISPRPPMYSGPTSRLSHRQSTQVIPRRS